MTKHQSGHFIPDPRLWTSEQVAARLNRSVQWLYDRLPKLRQMGFPDKDGELGRWDSKAIEVWLDQRSHLDNLPSGIEAEIMEAARGEN